MPVSELYRALERTPIQQIDVFERRLDHHVRKLTLRDRDRGAVEHPGAQQDLDDIDPPAVAVQPGRQRPHGRHF